MIAALRSSAAVGLAVVISIARAPSAIADEPPPDDGFLGARRVALAIDDCPRSPDLSEAARREAAAEHYDRGDVLYVQGDYEGAARELIASYCLVNLPILLKSIGQTYERMVQYEQAVTYYERYVVTANEQRASACDPEPAVDRKNMSSRIEVLRRLRSTVTVATEPPGSTIELASAAGRQALDSDGKPLQVVAGTYDMTVTRPGYEPVRRTITVGIGKPYSFSFRLEPRKGRLRVQAVPGDARIFVDGRLAGLGAYEGELPLGGHDVMVEAAGRTTRQVTVELVEGDNKPVAIELASPPGSGRRHLIGGSFVLGSLLGAGGGSFGGSGSGGAGFLLGGLGGLAAGYALIPRDVTLGTGSFLVSSSLAGGLNGLAVGGLFNDGDRDFGTEDDSAGAGYGLVGGAMLGLGVGLVLEPRLDISPGDAAIFNSGVSWGAFTGALFIPVFDASSRVRYATLLTGLDLGVIAGGLLAARYDVSRRRVVYIDLAGLAGIVGGLAVESAVSGARNDSGSNESTAHYALGGMAVGLGLGSFLTRNLDLPKLPRLTPTVTRAADGAGGQRLLLSLGGAL